MARSFCFYLILFLFLVNNINSIILINEENFLKRNLGSAREYRYRAKQRTSKHIPQHQQQQTHVSPDYLRARWIQLYNEQNKNN